MRTLVICGFGNESPVYQLVQHKTDFHVSHLPADSGAFMLPVEIYVTDPHGSLSSNLDQSRVVCVVINGDLPGKDAKECDREAMHLCRAAIKECPHAFIVLWHPAAVEDARLRVAAFESGACMVTCFVDHLEEALSKLADIGSGGVGMGHCSCAWCGQKGLTPDELWLHQPLYHIYSHNRSGDCCICNKKAENLAVHIHEEHYPGGPRRDIGRGPGAVVVVHRRSDNKFLMVQDFAGQGFCAPGGGTNEGETMRQSAVRECLEEAGVEVELQGLLEVDSRLCPKTGKLLHLAVFYATLRDGCAQQPKTLPCFESAGTCWVGAQELDYLPLRARRVPTKWFPFLAAGGQPKPLELPTELRHVFKESDF